MVFSEDNVILNNIDNLCNLERELGFVNRVFPLFSQSNTFLSDYDLEDDLIRASLDQVRKNKIDFEFVCDIKNP